MIPQRPSTTSKYRLRPASWGVMLLLFCLAILFTAGASFADDTAASTVADFGHVTVMELTGNYDANNPDGTINAAAREAATREFYRTHKDEYDFLILVTNFDFKMPEAEARAFYMGVKNDTRGIGSELFDNTSLFGSAGRLQGTIDIGNLSGIVTDPVNPDFENTFYIMDHELMHRWGARVRFRGGDGTPSSALLGKDGSHWSFLLDSQGSVLYGNSWKDNGDGTFTALEGSRKFSPLDLYLMGIYDKSQVPPMMVIDSPTVDPAQVPKPGMTITGTPRYVTIDDIIAVEGERFPPPLQAQKKFNAALVFLTTPESFTGDEITPLENLLKAWTTRYSILTDGAALISSTPAPIADLATNPGPPADGSIPRTLPASSDDGVSWLVSVQKDDGSWSGASLTTDKDTAQAVTVLRNSASGAPAASRGLAWIANNGSGNTDFLSAKICALADAGQTVSAQVATLLRRQNPDAGWGSDRNYFSNPIDTTLALRALVTAHSTDPALSKGVDYLLSCQNSDGGWGYEFQGASSVTATAEVSATLQMLPITSSQATGVTKATSFLLSHQNLDGGFGSSPSTVSETALAYRALAGVSTDTTLLGRAIGYLSATQGQDGSWHEDPYATALAVKALTLARTDAPPAPAPTTGTVSGTALDGSTGQALGGVMVTLASDPSIAVRTGAQGGFTLLNVPAGSQTVALSLNGYSAVNQAASVTAGSVLDLGTLSLSPVATAGMIKGTVTAAATGEPLSGVNIIVTGSSSGSVATGADGTFLLANVPPGGVTVTASKSGYQTVSTGGTVTAGVAIFFNPQLSADSSAPATGSVAGKVLDAATGRALSGVSVSLQGNPAIATGTDAAGAFTLSGIPQGSQNLLFGIAGYASYTATAGVSAGSTVNLGNIPLSATAATTGIRGTVTDASTGQPLTGVTVTLTGAFGGTTVTGADGSFAVNGVVPGTVMLTAAKGGYDPATLTGSVAAGGTLFLNPRLSAVPAQSNLGSLSGRVVDAAAGTPLGGVSVTLEGSAPATVVTDSTGGFALTRLPAGTARLSFALDGYATASATVQTAAGGNVALGDLQLATNPTTGTLKGAITDAAGGALSGVTVTVTGAFGASALSGDDGSFLFAQAAPGDVTVTATKAGDYPVTATGTLTAGGVLYFSIPLQVIPPDPLTGMVAGKVVDSSTGLPLSGVSVTVDGLGSRASTDATGSFLLQGVAPGLQGIGFSLPGYAAASARVEVVAGFKIDLGRLPLSANPATAVLKGIVTDAGTGGALQGATITLSGASAASTVSGADGSFSLTGVAPGDLVLSVSKSGYRTVSGSATVTAGSLLFVNFQLPVLPPDPTVGALSGTVVDAATNQTLSGVSVVLRGSDSIRTTTDATGAFTLGNIPPGTQSIDLSVSGYATATATVEIAAGFVSRLGNLPLSATPTTGIIKGSVRGASGEPLAGVTVTVTGAFSGGYVTGVDGSFLFTQALPGSVTLIASKSGYYPVSATGTVTAGGLLLANLQLAEIPPLPSTGSLAGKVFDAGSGSPLEGAQVSIAGGDPVGTDTLGSFAAGSLLPGTYPVTVSKPGYLSQNYQVMIIAGAVTEMQGIHLAALSWSTTVRGTITDASTGEGIEGAEVSVIGTALTTRTAADGSYRIDNIALLSFGIRASATGYNSGIANLTTAGYGDYRADFALEESREGEISIEALAAAKALYNAYDQVNISADIVNSGTAEVHGLVHVSIVNPQGGVVNVQEAIWVDEDGLAHNRFSFAPGTTKTVAVHWDTGFSPPGDYKVVATVIEGEPGVAGVATVADRAGSFAIAPTAAIAGLTVTPSPLFTNLGATEQVALGAKIINNSNVPVTLGIACELRNQAGSALHTGSYIIEVAPQEYLKELTLESFQQTFQSSGIDPLVVMVGSGPTPAALVGMPISVAPGTRIDPAQSLSPSTVTPEAEKRIRINIELKGVELK